MYETHFGLKYRPFRPTPDREAYYPATSHEQALAPLRQALADGEGLALLVGEPGSGKTLLCHRLLEGESAATAFLTNSHFPGRAGLLQSILFDLSLQGFALAHDERRQGAEHRAQNDQQQAQAKAENDASEPRRLQLKLNRYQTLAEGE